MAEQLLRGGIPAVRQAIEEQNARARADEPTRGHPGSAAGHGRAAAARWSTWPPGRTGPRWPGPRGKDVPLRELRSIVASSSTVTLDEEGTRDGRRPAHLARPAGDRPARPLGRTDHLGPRRRPGRRRRAGLDPAARAGGPPLGRARGPAGRCRRSGHVGRDPARGLAGPARGGGRLARCAARSSPHGLPAGADEAVLAAARKASGYVPELARLMGIPIPPPPGPRRPVPARSAQGRRAS